MRFSTLAARGARLRILVALAAFAAVAATVAAMQAQATPGRAAKGAMVTVRKTSLGRVLVDVRGRTLYLFEADKSKKSVCYGQCAAFWPPLTTTGAPTAGAGVKASLLGMSKRKDGKLQVTYNGHPLYFFAKDTKAGQTTGEGINHFGGEWYAVSASGSKVEKSSSPGNTTTTTTTTPTTTSSGGGGGGGGYGNGY